MGSGDVQKFHYFVSCSPCLTKYMVVSSEEVQLDLLLYKLADQ